MIDFSENSFENGEEEFETEYVRIEYIISDGNDFVLDMEMLFPDLYNQLEEEAEENDTDLEDTLENVKICYIERIDVDEDNRGKGLGSEFLSDFIQELKQRGINKIALTASYDLDEEDEDYDEKGLSKLVSFYQKQGIESCFGFSCNSDMVDMSND